MGDIKGNKTLSGTWAEVWYNGFKIAELNKLRTR